MAAYIIRQLNQGCDWLTLTEKGLADLNNYERGRLPSFLATQGVSTQYDAVNQTWRFWRIGNERVLERMQAQASTHQELKAKAERRMSEMEARTLITRTFDRPGQVTFNIPAERMPAETTALINALDGRGIVSGFNAENRTWEFRLRAPVAVPQYVNVTEPFDMSVTRVSTDIQLNPAAFTFAMDPLTAAENERFMREIGDRTSRAIDEQVARSFLGNLTVRAEGGLPESPKARKPEPEPDTPPPRYTRKIRLK